MLAGLQGASSLPGLYASPAAAQLGAANAAYSQPYQNLAQLLQPSVALAGLGTTSSGSGTSTQTSNPSWLDTINSGMGVAGKGLEPLSSLFAFSDINLKEDIAPVGKLADGRNLYSYRYKGDPEPRIGLLAQEEERIAPENVVEIGGFKAVNYDRALSRSKDLMGGPRRRAGGCIKWPGSTTFWPNSKAVRSRRCSRLRARHRRSRILRLRSTKRLWLRPRARLRASA
jgi:hypothetical protein